MKAIFSRYGGNSIQIGRGKAGHLNLPEDQSLDNMLDNHAINPVPNVIYLTSYVEQPEFMGNYRTLPPGTTYLGELDHEFMDVIFQFTVRTTSRVYIGRHHYPNVYSVFIHTDYDCLSGIWDLDPDERKPGYDYVLTFYFRGLAEEYTDVRQSPEQLEMMLILLAYHMGLSYSDVVFSPSKTWIGKLVREGFPADFKELIKKGAGDEDLKQIMQIYIERLSDGKGKLPKKLKRL
ncbi:MAG: hypothetical protein ACK45H_09055, partial [Bacteroidota bacterium]